jgi:hypothetical protein
LTGLVTVASLLLLALGPVSWIFAQSTESIVFMGILHLAFWFFALAYGLQYIKKSARASPARRRGAAAPRTPRE